VIVLSFINPLQIRGGPYRGRTGDLHNAIVALSQTELTALALLIIYPTNVGKSIQIVVAPWNRFE
jgi:hypothetical protein